MPRFEIDNDPIRVSYGYDFPVPGVFLAVCDKRLKWDRNASSNANAVTEQIGVLDGGGSYFDIHTGISGFGIKVDDQTMATFLRRFGVPEENIKGLPLKLYESVCNDCNRASSTCSKCKCITYCSQRCQKKDWNSHKIFCNMRESFLNKEKTNCVNALFLPQNSTEPLIVPLPFTWVKIDGMNCQSLDKASYMLPKGSFCGSVHSYQYAFYDRESPCFTLFFKDDYLRDDVSQVNGALQRLCRLKRPGSHENMHWRGNLVVVKNRTMSADCVEYVDIELKDTPDAICFLVNLVLTYAAASCT